MCPCFESRSRLSNSDNTCLEHEHIFFKAIELFLPSRHHIRPARLVPRGLWSSARARPIKTARPGISLGNVPTGGHVLGCGAGRAHRPKKAPSCSMQPAQSCSFKEHYSMFDRTAAFVSILWQSYKIRRDADARQIPRNQKKGRPSLGNLDEHPESSRYKGPQSRGRGKIREPNFIVLRDHR
jgi:hypothetical protein